MSSSFKKTAGAQPHPRYRTPSPPRNHFEPISPLASPPVSINGWGVRRSDNHPSTSPLEPLASPDQRSPRIEKLGNYDGGPMDVFASIALATQATSPGAPSSSQQLKKRSVSDNLCSERPIKRVRSEKLSNPESNLYSSKSGFEKTIGHEQSQESRVMEAELLLNFSQRAISSGSAHSRRQTIADSSQINHHLSPDYERVLSKATSAPCENTEEILKQCHNIDETDIPSSPRVTRAAGVVDPEPPAEGTAPSPVIVSTMEEMGLLDPQDMTERVVHQQCPDEVNGSSVHLSSPSGPIETHPRDFVDQLRSHADTANSYPGSGAISAQLSGSGEMNLEAKNSRTSAGHHNCSGSEVEPCNKHALMHDQADIEHQVSSPDPQEPARHSEYAEAGNENILDDAQSQHVPSASDIEASPAIVEDSSAPESDHIPAANQAVCASCKFTRNSHNIDLDNNSTSWISCDACKSWFHFACAGFKNEREVRGIDKFNCQRCKPFHGSTTYVRKSSRAHSAIDYAGLHQGVIKTSDERPEHHYIQPIKDGTITFLPDSFARMRPDLVTAEYFEKGVGMKEPIVIPAALNPRPNDAPPASVHTQDFFSNVGAHHDTMAEAHIAEDWFSQEPESRTIPDEGQDALDMVIPQGLTVRQVAEIYGPEEKVEVIDVKSQNGENRKWNMRRWADYYENANNKVVRNVISLEISQSKLGRLIRRPRVVRDLDLQDSVWPADLLAKGEYPRVQFYCLMSVADCFTDFHIDFGGSSVFYHILKGRKTFLFIPPKEKHLKKYEEWCMSPAQNWTFLADQTKECYRVDLLEGDTMLIPAGWIHAVWTPEDSLVVGGNFLTRMNFAMQLRIAQVEKATGVARKFRYPNFQKLHWYTAIRYLDDDPLPKHVRDLLESGGLFLREQPAHCDFDAWGENSRPAAENYHARYYSQPELEGLPDLTRYLLRTALIDIGNITEGITAETRNAVKKSIPRSHGEPLNFVKTFAVWCTWKRGNEAIPHWAYPDAVPESVAPDKLSAAATRRLDREAALQAPRRQSARMQSQQHNSDSISVCIDSSVGSPPESSVPSTLGHPKGLSSEVKPLTHPASENGIKRQRSVSSATPGSHRKTACESCRRRRRACKHKDEVEATTLAHQNANSAKFESGLDSIESSNGLQIKLNEIGSIFDQPPGFTFEQSPARTVTAEAHVMQQGLNAPTAEELPARLRPSPVAGNSPDGAQKAISDDQKIGLAAGSGNAMHSRPRTKACNDCRKSKRRCIHDAFGNEDPVKVAETAIPRPHARKINAQAKTEATRRIAPGQMLSSDTPAVSSTVPRLDEAMTERPDWRPAPVANMIGTPAKDENMPYLPGLPNHTEDRHSPKGKSILDPILDPIPTDPPQHTLDSLDLIDPISILERRPSWGEGNPSVSNVEAYEVRSAPVGAGTNTKAFAASSLVSPPASSHEDMEQSPPSASRQSSLQPKQQQGSRYTPESGPIRRASSSSYEGKARHVTPNTHGGVTLTNSHQGRVTKDSAPFAASETANAQRRGRIEADEESLKLIKEIQANDMGLRRRGKG